MEERVTMKNRENDNSKCLIQAMNIIEADSIIALLESYNIEAYKQYDDTGSYLNITMGYNYQGINVFVPENYYDDAMKILHVEEIDNKNEDNDCVWKLADASYSKKKKALRIILLCIIIWPVVVMLLLLKQGLL